MRLLIFIFFFITTNSFFAQEIKVLDKDTGKPINNVNVYNSFKTLSLTTNKQGGVNLSDVNNDEIIFFSHLSYTLLSVKKNIITKRGYKVYLKKQSQKLDEVILSVFKKEEKTNRIAEQIAQVSTKDIFKISPQTSADLLAEIPGIKVQKSQSGGGSPILRGMESNRVLLVVDGVRLNNAIYRKGHLQNSITVAPHLLEKVEVVFGPSSVTYGSDALGGVIHYYTKTPKISDEIQIISSFLSRYSSVNEEITNNYTAELSFKKWASLTSVSYSDFGNLRIGKNRTNGFKYWGKNFYYSENSEDDFSNIPTLNSDSNILRNTSYNQTDVLQKFFVPLAKSTDLKVNLQYSTSSNISRSDRLSELNDLNNLSSLKFAEWYYGPQKRLLLSSQLLLNPDLNWIENGVITTSYQNIQESRVQRKFGSLNKSYRKEFIDVFSLNGDFSVSLTKDKTRYLSYGFEFVYNDVNSNAYGKTLNVSDDKIIGFSDTFTVQSRYPDGGSNYLSSAAYLGYRQDINSKSTLNTGLRFTHTELNAKWIDDSFISLQDKNITLNNSAVTATIGYAFKPNTNWQLNSVLSSGFRSPNIDDVGRIREKADNITVPNILVKPEFAYNAELGVLKYFNDKKFKIGITGYYTLLDNYIQRDFIYDHQQNITQVSFDNELGNAVTNQNKGTAYISGFTSNYQGKITDNWSTMGSITFTKGKSYDTKEPLSSIPPLFGQFRLDYQKNKIELGVNFRFNSKKASTSYNITEGIDNIEQTPVINTLKSIEKEKYYGTPSWYTVGLNSSYEMNDNFTFQFRIANLLDVHYKEFASGISAPGRNFSISVLTMF